MRNYFNYNAINSATYGIYISGSGRISLPERSFELLEIPGRNGDLILDRKRIQNEILTYPAFIGPTTISNTPVTYPEAVNRFRLILMSRPTGYAALKDSYDSEHYRMAIMLGPVEFDSTRKLDAGEFELQFSCKPQRYLNLEPSDDVNIAAGGAAVIAKNGHPYALAEPLIRVTRTTTTGTFRVENQSIQFVTIAENPLSEPITIDCQKKTCYDKNGVNANRFVTFSDYEFPVFADNTLVVSTNVKLQITPRWYEL